MGQVHIVTMASTLGENDASWEKIKDPHNLLVMHLGVVHGTGRFLIFGAAAVRNSGVSHF